MTFGHRLASLCYGPLGEKGVKKAHFCVIRVQISHWFRTFPLQKPIFTPDLQIFVHDLQPTGSAEDRRPFFKTVSKYHPDFRTFSLGKANFSRDSRTFLDVSRLSREVAV